MSALEMLRAIARDNARSSLSNDEINEFDEITTPSVVLSDHERNEKNELSSPTGDLAERAALIEVGAGVPRGWAEGYAALSMMAMPNGFTPQRWQRIVDAAGRFIDQWAVKAAECGWSDLDVFGVHSAAPDQRFDAMGLVMLLDRADVVGIDPAGADLEARVPGGARTRFYRRPLPDATVSLWELAIGAEAT